MSKTWRPMDRDEGFVKGKYYTRDSEVFSSLLFRSEEDTAPRCIGRLYWSGHGFSVPQRSGTPENWRVYVGRGKAPKGWRAGKSLIRRK